MKRHAVWRIALPPQFNAEVKSRLAQVNCAADNPDAAVGYIMCWIEQAWPAMNWLAADTGGWWVIATEPPPNDLLGLTVKRQPENELPARILAAKRRYVRSKKDQDRPDYPEKAARRFFRIYKPDTECRSIALLAYLETRVPTERWSDVESAIFQDSRWNSWNCTPPCYCWR